LMRKVAVLLVLFFAIGDPARCQSSWKKVDVPSLGFSGSSILNSITASGNLVLSSVSDVSIYRAVRSTDGGATWETPPLTVLAPLKLKSLSETFLYGVRGDSIMTSKTRGVSWTVIEPTLNMNLADAHYINSPPPGQAWAVGDTNYAARTGDNWGSFLPQPFSIDSVTMSSVQFFDNNFGFVAGRSRKVGSTASVILRTTDGGQNWQNRGLPDTCSSTPLLVINFISPRVGWAVQTCGINANFYKTIDSGSTWSFQDSKSLFQVFAIDAVDSLHAWAVGQLVTGGAIAKTSNGGTSWVFETVPASSGRLLSIAMTDTITGFACGQSATLLVYSPIGTDVPGERSNRPKSFELSQNYPNPFNGETRITFTLQKSQPLTLTVYNILGQSIRTLIEGGQPAGKNEVGWDGRDGRGLSVPSGIYFYKLTTREEKQVRKMVLLK
jgi:photosystem II stability/assembly factor-like uncharacterized protein